MKLSQMDPQDIAEKTIRGIIAGWRREVAFLPRPDGDYEVVISEPLSGGTFVNWPKDAFIYTFRFEPQNWGGWPEWYGDNEEEAFETLAEEVANEIWQFMLEKGVSVESRGRSTTTIGIWTAPNLLFL